MPVPNSKRWVVLIQKKPRGPLTEVEVQALFLKGLVRANDLAFEISSQGKALTDWKMLWQFPEFDRRAKAAAEAAKKGLPAPPARRERRQSVTPESIQEKVNSQIPAELIDISPEDLIPRQRSSERKPVMEFSDLPGDSQDGVMPRPSRFAYGAVVLAVLGVAFAFKWSGSKIKNTPRPDDMRLPAMEEMEPSGRPGSLRERTLPTNLGTPPRSAARPSGSDPSVVPAARDEAPTPSDRDSDRDRGSLPYDPERDRAWDEESYDEESPSPKSRRNSPKPRKPRDPEDEVEAREDSRGLANGDDEANGDAVLDDEE